LLNDFSMDYFWCSNNYDKKSFIEAMYKIYTKEEEGKYWVLWIKIQLV
jgi:ASC-1-like (ASCH) protein